MLERSLVGPRPLLRAMLDAAIASARAEVCLPPHLPDDRDRPLTVIGFGKAAAAMAQVVESHWPGPLSGIVVTRYGYAVPCERISVIEAAHPVPDTNSVVAARRITDLVAELDDDDRVLCLVSGGGSSLLAMPPPGLSLADKQQVNLALLRSGASIAEMNVVRRHLSAIKGGRLAAATRARMLTLVMSDVPGDGLSDIASGPTVADASTCADALAILSRHAVALPEAARAILESGTPESIKPGDPRLARSEVRLVATPAMALAAAAKVARSHGVTPILLGDRIEGEARVVGQVLAAIARSAAHDGMPAPPPCVILSGGETGVTVRGDGVGGRNVECLLATALALDAQAGIHALMADTDGVDGAIDVAGAMIGPDTLSRAHAASIDPRAYLDRNDAHTFFARLGDQVVTGPTMTNVNDFRALLVLPG